MKGLVLITILALVGGVGTARGSEPFLSAYNDGMNRIQKTGMAVLGSWAAANFLGSGIPLITVPQESMDETIRYLLLMNIGWNTVNAGLSTAGFINCCKQPVSEISPAQTVSRQYRLEKTFLFNAGLDFGYMAFGLYLLARSPSAENPAMFEGFGYSLLVQGGALFVFDVAMQMILARHRKGLDTYLEELSEN